MTVEYLVFFALLTIPLAILVVYQSGPDLFRRFRGDQRAMASPIP